MKQILAAVDFSETSEAVVKLAEELASASGADVMLLHAAAPNPDFVGFEAGPQHVRDDRAHRLQEERRALRRLSDGLRRRGTEAQGRVVEGATVETVLHEAERLEADMIIVGSHGRGVIARALLGSISRGVLEGATCPVVVVPSPGRGDADSGPGDQGRDPDGIAATRRAGT